MSRVRVLRVITRLNVGGPAIHVAILTAGLDPERFESVLLAGPAGQSEGDMRELGRIDERLPVTMVPGLGRAIAPFNDLRALWHIYEVVRRFRPHIVHTHLAKAGLLGRLAARLAGVPVVIHTYHGSVFRGYFGKAESALYQTIESALSRISTRIVAITPLQRDELVRLGVAQPRHIEVIPLGLELDQFRVLPDRATGRAAIGTPADGPLFAIVGRLVPVKDIATFLRAFAVVRARLPGARAVVVGDGEERVELECLAASLNINDVCLFLGWRADLTNVYSAADAVVQSSLNEGSPVTLIEAMAAGTPVVATAVGGVPDIVVDGVTGLLVPARSPIALAAAMIAAIEDRTGSAARAKAARVVAFGRFSAARLLSDIERLYGEALDRVRS